MLEFVLLIIWDDITVSGKISNGWKDYGGQNILQIFVSQYINVCAMVEEGALCKEICVRMG